VVYVVLVRLLIKLRDDEWFRWHHSRWPDYMGPYR